MPLTTSSSPPNNNNAPLVDIRAKLASVPGGAQKHLVSLARVAFAEGEGDGIGEVSAEAAEAAHAMLDVLLSPEEGEAVVEVFGSSAGR